MRKNKILLPAAFLFAAISSAFAQGNGIAGITEATNMVTSYFDPGTKLVYAVGAVVGLIGGIKVYNKFFERRPRHVEDRRELVRRVYFPDCRRDDPTLFLLVVQPVMQIIMEYGINKGIGKSVEFRGLKAQYLFIFAGGLLAVFVVFVILYMAGVDQWVCIAFGVAAASVLVWLTFRLNARYGEHGLMKLLAARRHPRYLLNRKSLRRLLKRKGGRV